MNLCAPFIENVAGREVELRPLTVRERMKVSNALIERERNKAIDIARTMETTGKAAVEFVSERVENAERISTLIMSCFTLEGAMAVILMAAKSPDDAEHLGSNLEPGELGRIATKCLNVSVGSSDRSGDSGN